MHSTLPAASAVSDNDLPLAEDLLCGAAAIGKFIFGDDLRAKAKIYYLSNEVAPEKRLPVFRLGSVICSRKSTLRRWIAEREGGTA